MKKNFILVISFFLFHQLYSQNDFRLGYIITQTGDSIKGFIDYGEGSGSFEKCRFKKSREQDVVIYYPNQLKGYGFNEDKFFESKEIEIGDGKKEKVFIEVLVKGKVTLYKFKSTFYIKKNDSIFEKLFIEKSMVEIDGKIYMRESKRHIAILLYLLSDCSEIKKEIKDINLTEIKLTKLIEKYNNCIGVPSISYKKDKPWIKAEFGISLGLNYSSIKFDQGIEDVGFFTNDLGSSSTLMAGVYIDVSSPRINERVSFYAGILYLSPTFSESKIESTSSFNFRYDVNTKLKQIKIPIGFKYSFPEKNITPYLIVGISNNFNFESNTTWITERERNNIVETFEETVDLTDIRVGYWGAIGIKKQINEKLNGFLEVRYDNSYGFPSRDRFGQNFQYNVQSFQLVIGLNI